MIRARIKNTITSRTIVVLLKVIQFKNVGGRIFKRITETSQQVIRRNIKHIGNRKTQRPLYRFLSSATSSSLNAQRQPKPLVSKNSHILDILLRHFVQFHFVLILPFQLAHMTPHNPSTPFSTLHFCSTARENEIRATRQINHTPSFRASFLLV